MALLSDVKVDAKAVLTITTLEDQGDAHVRPGRNGAQGKEVIELHNLQMNRTELKTRISDASKVLQYGYRVDASEIPPIVETDEVTLLTKNSVKLNGRVTSAEGGNDLVLFQVGTNKELSLGYVVADEGTTGGVTTILKRSYAWAGLTPSTKYYYRIFCLTAVSGSYQYGLIRSFITPAV